MVDNVRAVVVLCLFVAAAPVAAQARLAPADFVVAGVPGNQPYIDISEDTVQIRKTLGTPRRVGRDSSAMGVITTWYYDGLDVSFGEISRVGITLTSPRVKTHRGLAVGDSARRVTVLYGEPAFKQEDEWVYEDPRERLHVIVATVVAGKVTQIFVGSLWD